MSQLDFIRDTTSDFFDALIDSNLADIGDYEDPRFPDLAPVSCRVLIRRAIASFGDFGRAPGQAIEVRLVNADVVGRRDGIVTVTSQAVGKEQFRLVERIADNGALSTWSVIRVQSDI
jgi:hypothetical protein